MFVQLDLQPMTAIPDDDIVEMLFFPVINEACRVLDERIAVKPSDLDIASIMGIGFPAHRLSWLRFRSIQFTIYIVTVPSFIHFLKIQGWSDPLGRLTWCRNGQKCMVSCSSSLVHS